MSNPFANGGASLLLSADTKRDKNKLTPSVLLGIKVPDEYSWLRHRGTFQTVFRDHMLHAYGHRCCLCDTRLGDALDAAHVVGWSISKEDRLNPRNGLLLCKVHHVLFDCGIILIHKDGGVAFDITADNRVGTDLFDWLIARTASKMNMPIPGYEPDPALLDRRCKDWVRDHPKQRYQPFPSAR